MLLQLEQECLDVYKRKVEQAAKSRAQLLQALSDGKLELSTLLSALGEKSSNGIVSDYLVLIFSHSRHEFHGCKTRMITCNWPAYSRRRLREQSKNSLQL